MSFVEWIKLISRSNVRSGDEEKRLPCNRETTWVGLRSSPRKIGTISACICGYGTQERAAAKLSSVWITWLLHRYLDRRQFSAALRIFCQFMMSQFRSRHIGKFNMPHRQLQRWLCLYLCLCIEFRPVYCLSCCVHCISGQPCTAAKGSETVRCELKR